MVPTPFYDRILELATELAAELGYTLVPSPDHRDDRDDGDDDDGPDDRGADPFALVTADMAALRAIASDDDDDGGPWSVVWSRETGHAETIGSAGTLDGARAIASGHGRAGGYLAVGDGRTVALHGWDGGADE